MHHFTFYCWLLQEIHDELVFEVEASKLAIVAAAVREAMEGAVQLSVPLRVRMQTGRSWGELADLTL